MAGAFVIGSEWRTCCDGMWDAELENGLAELEQIGSGENSEFKLRVFEDTKEGDLLLKHSYVATDFRDISKRIQKLNFKVA